MQEDSDSFEDDIEGSYIGLMPKSFNYDQLGTDQRVRLIKHRFYMNEDVALLQHAIPEASNEMSLSASVKVVSFQSKRISG